MHRLSNDWTRQLAAVLVGENQVHYTLMERIRTAQLFVFRIILADATRLGKTLKLDEQIGMRLGVETPRLSRHGATIDIEFVLPKELRRVLSVGVLPQQKDTTWVTVGQTPIGAPVRINLAGDNTAHALIAGQTGSGKTVAEQLISWVLATNTDPDAVGLILIDGKGGTKWWGFKRIPHLRHPVIGNAAEAVSALAWAVKEMDHRRLQGYSAPNIFIVIDELHDLIMLAGSDIALALSRLVSVGREWGIHVIAATQHPLNDAIGGAIIKANFTLRLVGQVVNARNAYLATGVAGTGAEKLKGAGDFLAVVNGRAIRLQMGLVAGRDFGRLARIDVVPRLDIADLDLARVLSVVDDQPSENGGNGRVQSTPEILDEVIRANDLEPLAWMILNKTGIKPLREAFKMGTDRARRIRDWVSALTEGSAHLRLRREQHA